MFSKLHAVRFSSSFLALEVCFLHRGRSYGSINSVVAKEISVNALFKIPLQTIETKVTTFI